jgi:hypothetical protein
VGCALAIPLPLLSVVAFLAAAGVGFLVPSSAINLAPWAGAAVLAILSLIGWIRERREAERIRKEREAEEAARLPAEERHDELIAAAALLSTHIADEGPTPP